MGLLRQKMNLAGGMAVGELSRDLPFQLLIPEAPVPDTRQTGSYSTTAKGFGLWIQAEGARGEWDSSAGPPEGSSPTWAHCLQMKYLQKSRSSLLEGWGALSWAPSPKGDAMAWPALFLAKPQRPALTLCSQFREIVRDEFKLKVKSQHQLESQ